MSFSTTMLVVTTCPQYTSVFTAAAVTVQVNSAGLRSRLSAASTAYTRITWAPTVKLATVCGEVHVSGSPPSSAHRNSVPGPGSFDENVNVAVVATVVRSGPESIVVSGTEVSAGVSVTVHSWNAGVASTLPVRSIVRASNRCRPSARPE
jgi:hypothetical protein